MFNTADGLFRYVVYSEVQLIYERGLFKLRFTFFRNELIRDNIYFETVTQSVS